MKPSASGHAKSRAYERLGFKLTQKRIDFLFDEINRTERSHYCPRGNAIYVLGGMTLVWDHSIETLVTFWENAVVE